MAIGCQSSLDTVSAQDGYSSVLVTTDEVDGQA